MLVGNLFKDWRIFDRLTSPMSSNEGRSSAEFHVYQAKDNLTNRLRSLTCFDTFGYEDVDIEVNPLCNILDEESENKDVVVDIEIPNLEESPQPQAFDNKNKEDKIIQKSMHIVSKAMFGGIVTIKEDEVQINGHADEAEPEEDLKEIVETVKNAVLSYRNGQDDAVVGCNANVIETRNDARDNLSGRLLAEHNCNDGGDRIVENGVGGEENLEMFNSYNYWRVDPEMPLDPTVVDAGRSPKKNKMIEEHNLVVSRILLWNIIFYSCDDTFHDGLLNVLKRFREFILKLIICNICTNDIWFIIDITSFFRGI